MVLMQSWSRSALVSLVGVDALIFRPPAFYSVLDFRCEPSYRKRARVTSHTRPLSDGRSCPALLDLHGPDRPRGVDAAAGGDLALERVELVHGVDETVTQLLDREARLDREDEPGHARDERRRHRGARVFLEPAAQPRRKNLLARRGDVDALHAVVRERGPLVLAVERGDREHVRQAVARREVRPAVVVRVVVARGGDEED